ncbi:hypothetical protein AGIG_G16781 [Arapaima gigas]
MATQPLWVKSWPSALQHYGSTKPLSHLPCKVDVILSCTLSGAVRGRQQDLSRHAAPSSVRDNSSSTGMENRLLWTYCSRKCH